MFMHHWQFNIEFKLSYMMTFHPCFSVKITMLGIKTVHLGELKERNNDYCYV